VQERIKACFTESIQTQIAAAEALPDAISRAAMTLVQSLLNGNKILCCGNGTSAANAQHFAASMINRFETERPSLPAIALNTDNVVLTAIANDRLHDEVYAKQVRALGHAGDVLLAISTRGNSRDIVKAVEAAVTRDMTIVALTGYDGGELAGLLGPQDVEIRIPSHRSARIQEMHMLTVNCLCDLIDNTILFSAMAEVRPSAVLPLAADLSAINASSLTVKAFLDMQDDNLPKLVVCQSLSVMQGVTYEQFAWFVRQSEEQISMVILEANAHQLLLPTDDEGQNNVTENYFLH